MLLHILGWKSRIPERAADLFEPFTVSIVNGRLIIYVFAAKFSLDCYFWIFGLFFDDFNLGIHSQHWLAVL